MKQRALQNQSNKENAEVGFERTCAEHEGEQITNFCTNYECLKPLCPDCIDIHNKMHLNNKTIPEITSLRNARINCIKKLKAANNTLTQEINHCELRYLLNPETVIEENIKLVNKSREKVITAVNNYFDGLEESVKRRVQENVYKAKDFNVVVDKMKIMIDEMKVLEDNLEREASLQNIRKVCLIDIKNLMDKFRSEISRLVQTRELDPPYLYVEDNRFYNLRIELEKLAFIHTKRINNEASMNHSNIFNANNLDVNHRAMMNTTNNPGLNHNFAAAGPGNRIKTGNSDPFELLVPEYFVSTAHRKFLHFFENNKNVLHYLNLEQVHQQIKKPLAFQQIYINTEFPIPSFHKSIATPEGELIFIGGTLQNEARTKSPFICRFDFSGNTLVPVANMVVPRSSHSICLLGNYIYIVGGFGNKQVLLNKCERLNIVNHKIEQIASLKSPVASAGLCSFGKNTLLKFGGISENQTLSPYIEKYDVVNDNWSIIDPKLVNLQSGDFFSLLSTCACMQINDNDIFIFGGYLEDNSASRLSYLFQMNSDPAGEMIIKCINWKPLPIPEGFWNANPIVFNNNMICLQNISNENNDDCIENKRRILMFDSGDWKVLN